MTAAVRGTDVNVVYADRSSDGLAQGNKKAVLWSGTTCTNGDAAACCRCLCNSTRASRNPRAYASCSSVTDRGNKTWVGVATTDAAAAPGGVVAPAVAAPYACCKMNLSSRVWSVPEDRHPAMRVHCHRERRLVSACWRLSAPSSRSSTPSRE